MDTEVLVALISCFGVTIGSLLTFIYQMKKLRAETEQAAIKQTEEFNKTIRNSIDANRNEYLEAIADVKKSVSEMNICVVDLKASWQSQMAMSDLRMEHLTKEFNDMKVEVREHNNFAKRMPVLEEKITVANHRIDDLEDERK